MDIDVFTKKVRAINGTLQAGDLVITTSGGMYDCLIGTVIDIELSDLDDCETDRVCVDFSDSKYSDKRKKEIERQFEEICGEYKPLKDLPLKEVSLEPNELIKITGLSEDDLKVLLCSKDMASLYCDLMYCIVFPECI